MRPTNAVTYQTTQNKLSVRAVASMGQGGQLPPPPILGVAPKSSLAPATVVSLHLAMGQLRLEKCIKTKNIQ